MVSTLFFWKFCFSLRTSYKEFISFNNHPNPYIPFFISAGILFDGGFSVRILNKSSFVYLDFIFSERITITPSEEVLKVLRALFWFRKYKRKVSLLLSYLLSCDSSKSTFFILNMAFEFVLSMVFVKLTNRNSSFLAIQKALQEYPSFFSACMFWYVFLLKPYLCSLPWW